MSTSTSGNASSVQFLLDLFFRNSISAFRHYKTIFFTNFLKDCFVFFFRQHLFATPDSDSVYSSNISLFRLQDFDA